MKSLQKNKGVVLAVILLVIVMFGYKTLFKTSQSIDNEGDAARNIGTDLVALFESLQGVNLHTDLFGTPTYKSLSDFSTEIPTLQVGRTNPFDVIGR